MQANFSPEDNFKGVYVTNPVSIKQKLRQVKAFVFDWDGVFNDGRKNIDGHSSFSEVDSMGTNLMRFSYFLQHKQLPLTAIITGENNQLAFSFAKRENFTAVYYKAANKEKAFLHFCTTNKISPADVMFVFDDALDLPIAKLAGVRFMVGRVANPLLTAFAIEKRLVDYITQYDGNNYAIREISEMVMAISNNFDLAVDHRMRFSELYQSYLNQRNNTTPNFYTLKDNEIIQP